jgi:hypothetical protein
MFHDELTFGANLRNSKWIPNQYPETDCQELRFLTVLMTGGWRMIITGIPCG